MLRHRWAAHVWAALSLLVILLHTVNSQNSVDFTIRLENGDLTDTALEVPASFLGLSIEPALKPLALESYTKDEVFKALLRHLTGYQTGPLNIRLGGHTQDETHSAYDEAVWDSLVALHTALNKKIQYSLPINFKSQDPEAQKVQLEAALQWFSGEHQDAVYAISVGNEPDEYHHHNDPQSPTQFDRHWMGKHYWPQLEQFIGRLAKTVSKWSGGSSKMFAGPGVFNPRSLPSPKLAELAAIGKDNGEPYFKVATLHWPGLKSHDAERAVSTFLGDNTMEQLYNMSAGRAHAARASGIELRVDQISPVQGAGLPQASDTMAGALFVVRASLTLMQAGVSGVNFHSTGCAPNGPILLPSTCVDPYYVVGNDDSVFSDSCPNSCGQADAPAEVNAPYYGLWFMQKLLRHHKTLKLLPADAVLPDSRNTNDLVSVYVLQNTHALRVVIVNTNAATDEEGSGDETITIVLKGSEDSPHDWGYGTLTHLMGDSGLDSTEDHMTLGGQHINPEHGTIEYNHYTCKVDREVDNVDNTISYTFVVSEGSAAILVVPDTRRLQSTKTAAWLQDGLPETVSKCPVH